MAVRTTRVIPEAQDNVIHDLEKELEQLNKDLYQAQKKKEDELQRLRLVQKNLSKKLSEEISKKGASVQINKRGLVIQFLAQVFFNSGSANLTKQGQDTLSKIVPILVDLQQDLRIEGHTDNEKINRSRHLFSSNWDLSAMRALTVLEHFLGCGINPERLAFAAYGEHRPLFKNTTPANRKKNKRVEVVIIPDFMKQKSFEEKTSLSEKKRKKSPSTISYEK